MLAQAHIQTSNLKSFHPEILKKSNHILRNCKNGNSTLGEYSNFSIFQNLEFFYSARKKMYPGGNFLNLSTVLSYMAKFVLLLSPAFQYWNIQVSGPYITQ